MPRWTWVVMPPSLASSAFHVLIQTGYNAIIEARRSIDEVTSVLWHWLVRVSANASDLTPLPPAARFRRLVHRATMLDNLRYLQNQRVDAYYATSEYWRPRLRLTNSVDGYLSSTGRSYAADPDF